MHLAALLGAVTGYAIPVLGFLFVFTLVVFVHELGHFLTAKWSDVEVEAFSIGMGPVLYAHQYGETEYRLSALPLGGYVSLVGEQDREEAKDNPRAFCNKNVWARTLILLAGGIGNLLLGYFVYVGFGMFVGKQVLPAKVGYVAEEVSVETETQDKTKSVQAPAAGKLQVGDQILSINGYSVENFQDVLIRNQLLGSKTRRFLIQRGGEKKVITIDPVKVSSGGLGQPSHIVGIQPYRPPVVGTLKSDGKAREYGFKEGDRIARVAGTKIQSFKEFQHALKENRGSVKVQLLRSNQKKTITLNVPGDDKKWRKWAGSLGIIPPRNTIYYGFFESFGYAAQKTGEMIYLMFESLWKLATQQISPKSLAGPVGIADMTGRVSQRGFIPLLGFAAFFSINLGVINLLPIPVLDGGHILLLIPEMVTGKMIPEPVQATFNYIGLSLLLALILFITMIDFCRYEWFTQFFGSMCTF